MVIEQIGFYDVQYYYDIRHPVLRLSLRIFDNLLLSNMWQFGNWIVTTCFNEFGMLRPGFEHKTFHMKIINWNTCFIDNKGLELVKRITFVTKTMLGSYLHNYKPLCDILQFWIKLSYSSYKLITINNLFMFRSIKV